MLGDERRVGEEDVAGLGWGAGMREEQLGSSAGLGMEAVGPRKGRLAELGLLFLFFFFPFGFKSNKNTNTNKTK